MMIQTQQKLKDMIKHLKNKVALYLDLPNFIKRLGYFSLCQIIFNRNISNYLTISKFSILQSRYTFLSFSKLNNYIESYLSPVCMQVYYRKQGQHVMQQKKNLLVLYSKKLLGKIFNKAKGDSIQKPDAVVTQC